MATNADGVCSGLPGPPAVPFQRRKPLQTRGVGPTLTRSSGIWIPRLYRGRVLNLEAKRRSVRAGSRLTPRLRLRPGRRQKWSSFTSRISSEVPDNAHRRTRDWSSSRRPSPALLPDRRGRRVRRRDHRSGLSGTAYVAVRAVVFVRRLGFRFGTAVGRSDDARESCPRPARGSSRPSPDPECA